MKSVSLLSMSQQSSLVRAGADVWWVRLWTVLVGVAISWSILYWVGLLGGDAMPSPSLELAKADLPINDPHVVARALGSDAAERAMSVIGMIASRYQLQGVAMGDGKEHDSGLGLALISVDGQPARPYRLNAILPSGERVMELARSSALLRLNDGQELLLQVPDPRAPLPSQSAAVIQSPQMPSGSSVPATLPANPAIAMPVVTEQYEFQPQQDLDISARREEMRASVYANRLSKRAAKEQQVQTRP